MPKRNSQKEVRSLLIYMLFLENDMVQSQWIRDVEIICLIGRSVSSVGICLYGKTDKEEGGCPHDWTKRLQEVVMVAPCIRAEELRQISWTHADKIDI